MRATRDCKKQHVIIIIISSNRVIGHGRAEHKRGVGGPAAAAAPQRRAERTLRSLRGPRRRLRRPRQRPRHPCVRQGTQAPTTHELLHHIVGHRRSLGWTVRDTVRDTGEHRTADEFARMFVHRVGARGALYYQYFLPGRCVDR